MHICNAGSNRRIYTLDRHLGLTFAGLSADARALVNRARSEAKQYKVRTTLPRTNSLLEDVRSHGTDSRTCDIIIFVKCHPPHASASAFPSTRPFLAHTHCTHFLSTFHLPLFRVSTNHQSPHTCSLSVSLATCTPTLSTAPCAPLALPQFLVVMILCEVFRCS